MCINTIQRFGVSKMFLKKILILKKAAFIWSEIQYFTIHFK